jgi:predicted nucleotidyltransferase component of viral defense system
MLSKDNIMKIAGEKKLNPSAVSKDYALGWLLFGIMKSSISSKLIFKGGTGGSLRILILL